MVFTNTAHTCVCVPDTHSINVRGNTTIHQIIDVNIIHSPKCSIKSRRSYFNHRLRMSATHTHTQKIFLHFFIYLASMYICVCTCTIPARLYVWFEKYLTGRQCVFLLPHLRLWTIIIIIIIVTEDCYCGRARCARDD